jgi:hypothetical protein
MQDGDLMGWGIAAACPQLRVLGVFRLSIPCLLGGSEKVANGDLCRPHVARMIVFGGGHVVKHAFEIRSQRRILRPGKPTPAY